MIERQAGLLKRIESIIGREQMTVEPSIIVDGLKPSLLIYPVSTDEVARCLLACAENDAAVIPAGHMTWLECGNPLKRADVVLSLERMGRIIEYSPADLTITVEAGLALSEFNATTGREGQWLPLDPPGSERASLGAIAACNSTGALRFGYGRPRDYVLGLRLAHVDGTESKSGGRVVKNVAGYDLNKLYVGSFGTLAVITELTFKLLPMPEGNSTIVITPKNPERLTKLSQQILQSELRPVSMIMTNLSFDDIFGIDHTFETLAVRFIESEAAVLHQVSLLTQLCKDDFDTRVLTGNEGAEFWSRINDIDCRSDYGISISVPISEAVATYDRALDESDCVVTADLGTGIIRVAFDGVDSAAIAIIKRLRDYATELGGSVMIERASSMVRRQADAWGDVGATARLMQSIKAKFDPKGILNPGRFVAGI